MKVKLTEIVHALDDTGDMLCYFLNSKTGELYGHFENDVDPDDEAPDVFENDDWIPLPDSFQIHHWQIMRDFCETREGDERLDLLDAIHGRGAFRMFRATVERLGIDDVWYKFRLSTLREMAVEWLEEEGIQYE